MFRRGRLRLQRSERRQCLAAVKISSLPAAGTLSYNGAAIRGQVSAGFEVSAAICGRHVALRAGHQCQRRGHASFGFQVRDDGGTANGGSDLDRAPTLTIDVTAVNDAPAGTNTTVTTPRTRRTSSPPPTSASRIRTTGRPTPSQRCPSLAAVIGCSHAQRFRRARW